MQIAQQGLSECILSRWQPGFNDPYLTSWAMVAIYLVTAFVALAVVHQNAFPISTARLERFFWIVLAVFLVGLAANKQADLQSLLPAAGRCLSKAQGWFEHRRKIQAVFTVLLSLLVLGGVVVIFLNLRPILKRYAMVLLGMTFIAGFVLIRAAEFNHFDTHIGALLSTTWTRQILELLGPIIVSVAAIKSLLAGRSTAISGSRRPNSTPDQDAENS